MPAEVFSKSCDPQARRGRVRRESHVFLADFETIRGYLETAGTGCGRTAFNLKRIRLGMCGERADG